MAGATTSISGNGVVNDTAQAKNFAYYGLPSNTTINITGNGAFYGTIYAPQADFNLKGSGKTSVDDFTGASITKTTTMTGNFNFHYDENLIHLTTLGGYDAASWEEM
jgi:choice-of-anchor A domain-containing protein